MVNKSIIICLFVGQLIIELFPDYLFCKRGSDTGFPQILPFVPIDFSMTILSISHDPQAFPCSNFVEIVRNTQFPNVNTGGMMGKQVIMVSFLITKCHDVLSIYYIP